MMIDLSLVPEEIVLENNIVTFSITTNQWKKACTDSRFNSVPGAWFSFNAHSESYESKNRFVNKKYVICVC